MTRRFVVLVFAASAAFAHQGLHEQIAEASRRIAGEPENARVYLHRGELHRIHGDAPLALRDYARAEKLDPALFAVDLGRARLYFDARRYGDAKGALDRLLRNAPDGIDAAVLRARTLTALGSKAALAEWERASRLHRDPPPEFFIEWSNAVPEVDGAIAVLDDGIARLGPLVTLELPAIELELRRRKYDAALRRIDLLAGQSPRKESWLARKGEILVTANRTAEACQAFDRALHSLESLPEPRRRTRATLRLEQRIAAGLTRCKSPGQPPLAPGSRRP